jgi:hypothetical protein
MKRTVEYQQMPWLGGRNSTLDPAIVPNNQLSIADNTLFATDLARRKRPGFQYMDLSSIGNAVKILAGADYWSNVSSVKTQREVLITDEPKIYSMTTAGVRTELTRNIGYLVIQDITLTATVAATGADTYTITYTTGGTAGVEAVSMVANAITVQIESGVSTATQVAARLNASSDVTAKMTVAVTGTGATAQVAQAVTTFTHGTAMVAGATAVATEVINEDIVIAFNNTTSPKKWKHQTGTTFENLGGSPPNFAFCRSHINRLFAAGDPANPDRLYYSSTENHEEWNGAGTSGAIDIFPGDGDPEGLTAIFPATKGVLFVAKRNRLYRVDTSDPDDVNWTVDHVSRGIGCIGHNAVCAVGQDDMLFVSDRGVHSMAATQKFGDFESAYLSKDIQKEFHTWNKDRFKQFWMCFVPEMNSVLLAVSPDGFDSNNEIHLFNVEDKQWYRFPELACESMWVAKIDNRNVLVLGNSAGRVNYLSQNTFNDNGVAISFDVKTGTIYPDNQPRTVKDFKKVSLFYKPKESGTITAKFKIDNFDEQTLTFDVSGQFDALGTEFVLGESVLGLYQPLPVITLPVDGAGHGFSLRLLQSGLNEEVEVYGFAVEYESAGDQQESRN